MTEFLLKSDSNHYTASLNAFHLKGQCDNSPHCFTPSIADSILLCRRTRRFHLTGPSLGRLQCESQVGIFFASACCSCCCSQSARLNVLSASRRSTMQASVG